MKTAQRIFLTMALLIPSFAGCLGPIKGQLSTTSNPVSETLTSVTSTVTSQTQELVDKAQHELAWALSTRELLYAAAVRQFASPDPDANIETIRYFGFSEKGNMRLMVYHNSDLLINKTILLFGEPHGVLAPLVVPFDAANLTQWDEHFDGVETGMPSLDEFGEDYSYFLSSFTGTPVWVVTFHGDDTTERRVVDFSTGASVSPNINAPFPSTPNPYVPDINSSTARPVANATARAILPDADLVIIKSEELLGGGVGTTGVFPGLDEMILPPDWAPSDGKAPGWLYMYVSRSTNQAIPVLVYSSGVVWTGKVLTVDSDVSGYRELFSAGNLFDSTDAVTVMTPLAKKHRWEYRLDWVSDKPYWRMDEPVGRHVRDYVNVDATDLSHHCTGGYC